MSTRTISCTVALSALVASASFPAVAQDAVALFYRGKQITILVGSSPGGGYDTYSRLIGRHMGKHVPGNPTMVVSNMPGAGGNLVANRIFTTGAKDGTEIGGPQSGVILEPLLGSIPVQHDPSKFHYLGSANNDVYICVARLDAPAKSFQDVFDTPLILGASNASSTADYPVMLNNVLGTKFKIVTGYTGSREIALAIDKGEAHAACGLAWPSISVTQADWFKNGGTMRVIVQTHAKGHPDLNKQGVPLASSFAKTDEQRAMLELFFSQTVFGRPYILAPEVPAERVAALRKGFADTFSDPDFVAEAKKLQLDIDRVSGEEVQELVTRIYRSPPELIAKTKQALATRS